MKPTLEPGIAWNGVLVNNDLEAIKAIIEKQA